MKRSKLILIILAPIFIIIALLLFILLGRYQAYVTESTQQSIELVIDYWGNGGVMEWQSALMDPTELGKIYEQIPASSEYLAQQLEEPNNSKQFTWWLLINISMPEQQALLEPLALAASAKTEAQQRYFGLHTLARIGSVKAAAGIQEFVNTEAPVHLKIELIRKLANYLTPEAEPAVQQLLQSHANILAPEIQREIKNTLKDYSSVSALLQQQNTPPTAERFITLHILAILNQPPATLESQYRIRVVVEQLGEVEARDLFRNIAEQLQDPNQAAKLDILL